MRPLVCFANTVFALALTLHGCWQAPALRTAGPRVGSPAPETAGEDLDGVPFRLSDYRGNVVVLDFWGDW